MKKVAAIIAVAIIAYSIYYDLTIGTLSSSRAVTAVSVTEKPIHTEQDVRMPYDTKKTKPGDTIISIVEEMHQGPLPVSIDQLIDDFRELNGLMPDEIQAEKIYKFPVYSRSDD